MRILSELIAACIICLIVGTMGGHFVGMNNGLREGFRKGATVERKVFEDQLYSIYLSGQVINVRGLRTVAINIKQHRLCLTCHTQGVPAGDNG